MISRNSKGKILKHVQSISIQKFCSISFGALKMYQYKWAVLYTKVLFSKSKHTATGQVVSPFKSDSTFIVCFNLVTLYFDWANKTIVECTALFQLCQQSQGKDYKKINYYLQKLPNPQLLGNSWNDKNMCMEFRLHTRPNDLKIKIVLLSCFLERLQI